METLSLIGNAFAGMMNPMSILLLIVGVAVGIVFGSIPGLSAAMAVALFLPVTFAMQAHEAFTLLVALYIGGISGGLISAILINIPGTSSSIATCFDGSPMAKKGEAGKALGTGVVFSFLGGLFSFLVLMFVAPSVAQITLKFSAIEYFGVCLFALSMIAALAGTSMIKGLLSGCLGLIIALVGMAPIDGTKRFTFGINELSSGFDILPTLIGIFAIAEVLAYAEEVKKMGKATQIKQSFKIKGFGFTWKEFVGQKWNALRSALIGTGIGILPGIGGSTAGILSWMTAKKTSKHPEKYGTGIMDGVVASETSNNAVIGGALIPLLTLGIPGDGVTAMLLGAFMIHGLKQSFKIKGFGFTWKEFVGQKWNALRSALIGTGIGILPGIGGSTAGILSWMTAKKTSKHPEKYGTGIMDGVVASETSNNAVIGGALIPLLTLGIPGDGVTAMLLGAFMIHGLTPGPLLFVESADLIYTIFIACILANVVMLVLELGGMRIFVRLLSIPKYILLPVVLVLCTVGAFATNNRIFDAQSIVIFGVLGYLMSKFKIPVAPFILSFILCDLLETNLRRGLMLTQNDFLAFFTHPIAAVFMVAAVLFVVWTVIKQVRNRKKETAGAA